MKKFKTNKDRLSDLEKRGNLIKESFQAQFNKIKRINEYSSADRAYDNWRTQTPEEYHGYADEAEFSEIDYLEIDWTGKERNLIEYSDTIHISFSDNQGCKYHKTLLNLISDEKIQKEIIEFLIPYNKSGKTYFETKDLSALKIPYEGGVYTLLGILGDYASEHLDDPSC